MVRIVLSLSFTRFTVGLYLSLSSLPVSLLGYTSASLLFTRFTVGLGRRNLSFTRFTVGL